MERAGRTCQVRCYIVDGNVQVSKDYGELGHLLWPGKSKINPGSVFAIVWSERRSAVCVHSYTTFNRCEIASHFLTETASDSATKQALLTF